MILYLDTSSLVKLYIDEEHSDLVRAWAERAEVLCTSRLAYPQAVAAIVRQWREGDLEDHAYHAIRLAMAEHWQDFSVINLDEQAAAELAGRHTLSGYHAIHLAAALEVLDAAGSVAVTCSFFDQELKRAARDEGLSVLEPNGNPSG